MRATYKQQFFPGDRLMRKEWFHGWDGKVVTVQAVRRRPLDPRGDILYVQANEDLRPWTTASNGWSKE